MSWKKRFAPSVFMSKLLDIGPMQILKEPESLGQGKFRVRLHTEEKDYTLTTYESTIGNILVACAKNGWCVAYEGEELRKDGTPYINFKPHKVGMKLKE